MREQLTPQAIALLVGAIVVFWIGFALAVRGHARRAARRTDAGRPGVRR